MLVFFGSIVGYLLLTLIVALFAKKKGYDGITFFFLSLIITPLIGFIIVVLKNQGPSSSAMKACSLLVKYLDAAGALIVYILVWVISRAFSLVLILLTLSAYGYSLYLLGVHIFQLLKEATWANSRVINLLAGPEQKIYEWKGVVAILKYTDFIVIFVIALFLTSITIKVASDIKQLNVEFKDWNYFLDK